MSDASVEAQFTAWALAARPRLLRTATALTAGDRHLAEDLVQTALARTYAAWPRIRRDRLDQDGPDAYVHRVLVRAFIDETRRPWWRRERGNQPPDAVEPAASPPPDPDDIRAVRDALALLPPDQRAAVVLRHWAGHDVAETARLLGCPPATVRSRSARGLARLRDLLRDDELEPTASPAPPTPGGAR